MWPFLLAHIAGDEKSRDKLFLLTHVTKGGCLDEYEAMSKKCRRASPADPDACIKAKAALRKCFGRNPELFFGDYYAKRPEWFLPDEWKHEKAYVMFHVARGG